MRKEHNMILAEPTLLLDMPLAQGDLTDHISGGSVANNGKCAWNTSVGAYQFTQSGYGLSNVPYVTGLSLPFNAQYVAKFGRSFDIYPISSGDGTIIILGHNAAHQNGKFYSFSVSFNVNTSSNPMFLSKNTWHNISMYRDDVNSEVIVSVDGVEKSGSGNFNPMNPSSAVGTVSPSTMLISCGMYSQNSRASFCLKNLKYWSL